MRKIILFLMLGILFIAGCSSNSETQKVQNVAGMSCATDSCSADTAQATKTEVQKLEIYHFHPTNQCNSCRAVGAYAEETVNTYFADELKSGKIVFAHINAQLPENEELAKKYGVTGSSLWIGVYDKEGFHAEQNTNVWYKINDKEDYMNYLKGIIEKRLAGDYS